MMIFYYDDLINFETKILKKMQKINKDCENKILRLKN